MSAGSGAGAMVNRDFALLAPAFRAAVDEAIAECGRRGLDAMVFEGYRSAELQALYYARGRTVIPPTRPVTNARSNLFSWHGYGLAVDVISRANLWAAGEPWFRQVAECFAAQGCRWGGEWVMRDLPHFQWGRCKPSPSPLARELLRVDGVEGVWTRVGAL